MVSAHLVSFRSESIAPPQNYTVVLAQALWNCHTLRYCLAVCRYSRWEWSIFGWQVSGREIIVGISFLVMPRAKDLLPPGLSESLTYLRLQIRSTRYGCLRINASSQDTVDNVPARLSAYFPIDESEYELIELLRMPQYPRILTLRPWKVRVLPDLGALFLSDTGIS